MGKITEQTDVDISVLIPYTKNAKQHSEEQVKKIADSITEFGFLNPILIDKDYNVIAGHGRIEASKLLGLKSVPCIFVEGLTEAQRRAYILADNKLTELGDWNMDLVYEELDALEEFGFNTELTGFSIEDTEEDAEVQEDDYNGEPPEEPRAKLGDVWKLGNHRLVCGDSTDVCTIDRLMDGIKAKLLLTDPPYGINADKGVGGFGSSPKTANKYDDEWDSFSPSKDTFDMILEKADNSIIFGGNYFTDKLPLGKCWIVWDKVGDIQFKNPYSDCELAWTNIDRNSVKKYTKIQQGFVADEKEKRVHPTQKPVGLIGYILKDFSQENDTVLDFFGGSGSTLIACEQLNRRCFMCELDPHYVDVIIDRWEKFTGKKAELIS